MQKNYELANHEQKTDAEIALAIHYLDPEFCSESARGDTGTLDGSCIALLTGLTSAITYICVYMRNL